MNIFMISMMILGAIWPISFALDRRKIRNGFYFMVSYVAIFTVVAQLSADFNIEGVYGITVLLLVLPFFIVPLFLLLLFTLLFSTTLKLLKNEGVRFHNLLGIAFAGLMILWMIVFPLLMATMIKPWQQILFILLTGYTTYFFFMFAIYIIAAFTYAISPKRRKTNDYIIVLGAGLLHGEKVTPLLASRIDKAIYRYTIQRQAGKQAPIIILSGGQGPDEKISEAEAMFRYAVERGVTTKHLLKERNSTNTYENMLFSKELIEERIGLDTKGLFATNSFHVFRASLYARQVGLKAEGVGSSTKFYYFLNALIREFIAILMMHKKMQIIIFLLSIIAAFIVYVIFQINVM